MDLQRVGHALLRAAPLLLVAAIAALLVAAGAAALRADQYETRALVDVNRLVDDEDAFSNSERSDRTVANELVNAESLAVARSASQRLGDTTEQELRESVSIEQLTGTDNIAFLARAADPDEAARRASEYATAYAADRLDQRRASLRREREEIARELAALQEQLTGPDADTPQADSRQEALRAQYTELVRRDLETAGRARQSQDPQQYVLAAPVPDAAAGPGPMVWGLLAAALTLATGALLVAVRQRTRDPVELRSDVEAFDLPVLAEVAPSTTPWRRRSAAAAAVRAAAVHLAVREPLPGVVTVLAADARETTDVLKALAHHLGQQGVRVYRSPQPRHGGSSATTAQMTLLEGSLHPPGTEGLASLRHADLVLLVVTRGVSGRADVSRTLDELDQVSTAPRAALLIQPGEVKAGGDELGPPGGLRRLPARDATG